MKNLSEIPPDIATEAAAFFHTEESFRLSLETARKVLTLEEQEELFQEVKLRGTPDTRATLFLIHAGGFVEWGGMLNILKHTQDTPPAPAMEKAVGDIVKAIEAAQKIPQLKELLAAKKATLHHWEPGPGHLYEIYPAPDIPPQGPLSIAALMESLKEQLHRVEIESKKGPKGRVYRREMVRNCAAIWEKATGEKPTLNEKHGFLAVMKVLWGAAARAGLAHIEGRKRLAPGWQLPPNTHLEALTPGAHDFKNELRALLREQK